MCSLPPFSEKKVCTEQKHLYYCGHPPTHTNRVNPPTLTTATIVLKKAQSNREKTSSTLFPTNCETSKVAPRKSQTVNNRAKEKKNDAKGTASHTSIERLRKHEKKNAREGRVKEHKETQQQ
jgi:hypothetical protein